MSNTQDNQNPNENPGEIPVKELEHLVPEFLEKRKKELASLFTWIEEKNYEEIRALTHKWKGYSEPYGFGRLGELAKDMNVAAHSQDHTTALKLFAEMKLYLKGKEAQIKSMGL